MSAVKISIAGGGEKRRSTSCLKVATKQNYPTVNYVNHFGRNMQMLCQLMLTLTFTRRRSWRTTRVYERPSQILAHSGIKFTYGDREIVSEPERYNCVLAQQSRRPLRNRVDEDSHSLGRGVSLSRNCT